MDTIMLLFAGHGIPGKQGEFFFSPIKTLGKLTLIESLQCVRLVLWDERSRRLISFNELRRQRDLSATFGRIDQTTT